MNNLPPVGPATPSQGAGPAKKPELTQVEVFGPNSTTLGENSKFWIGPASIDPKKSSVKWEVIPPPPAQEVVVVNDKKSIDFLPNQTGTYVLRVTITDKNSGRLVTNTLNVTVKLPPEKEPPKVGILGPRHIILGESDVYHAITGRAITNPENMKYKWAINTPEKNLFYYYGPDFNFKPKEVGTYLLKLSVPTIKSDKVFPSGSETLVSEMLVDVYPKPEQKKK